jgi:GMP synthase-like glutamine amidotransferase
MAPSPIVLVLDNSPRRLASRWFARWFKELDCEVRSYHLWDGGRVPPLGRFQAMIIAGSPASATEDRPWILEELRAIEQADHLEMPVLGVCFGAQLLARAYYGKPAVRRSPRPELGWHQVKHETDDLLFEGVSHVFTSFQYHFEEVIPQPGMYVLATNDASPVQAFRIGEKPIWGIQFHAEVTPQAGRDLLRRTRQVYEPYGLRYETLAAGARPCGAMPQLFSNFVGVLSR